LIGVKAIVISVSDDIFWLKANAGDSSVIDSVARILTDLHLSGDFVPGDIVIGLARCIRRIVCASAILNRERICIE